MGTEWRASKRGRGMLPLAWFAVYWGNRPSSSDMSLIVPLERPMAKMDFLPPLEEKLIEVNQAWSLTPMLRSVGPLASDHPYSTSASPMARTSQFGQ